MAITFLAGVADARIFKDDELFATAKTLVDSSISIGVSAEDIRAGKGAKLYGKYFHTSTFDLKMTDAMFKLEYIAANVGADLQIGGEVFKTVEVKGSELADKKFTDAKPMVAGKTVYVYVRKSTEADFKTYALGDDFGITQITPDTAATYCVEYLYLNDNARKLVVNANFTPDTVSVYLDANLYSGDAENPSTGTKIGTITIKVPRFLLNGTQELSMSMTGASQTPFEGSALATRAEGCDGEGIYAEIIEVVNGVKWLDGVDAIIVDGEASGIRAGEDIIIYARSNSALKQLKLTATEAADGYKVEMTKDEAEFKDKTTWETGAYVITFTAGTNVITHNVTVA